MLDCGGTFRGPMQAEREHAHSTQEGSRLGIKPRTSTLWQAAVVTTVTHKNNIKILMYSYIHHNHISSKTHLLFHLSYGNIVSRNIDNIQVTETLMGKEINKIKTGFQCRFACGNFKMLLNQKKRHKMTLTLVYF